MFRPSFRGHSRHPHATENGLRARGQTIPTAINNAGLVAGNFHCGGHHYGFIHAPGNNRPCNTSPYVNLVTAYSIAINIVNNAGDIVGSYTDPDSTIHGLLGVPLPGFEDVTVPEPESLALLATALGLVARRRA